MTPETLFRASQVSRDKLRALLDDPVMAQALRIVGDLAKPRGYPHARPGAHYDTVTSQHYSKQFGIQHALDRLERLTTENPPEGDAEDEENEFMHGLTKEMREALQKQFQQQQPS